MSNGIIDKSAQAAATASILNSGLQQPNNQSFASDAKADPFGIGTISLTPGRLAGSPIRNVMGAESYVKLCKEMREIVKEESSNQKIQVSVLELDRNVDPNIHFSCIVIASQSMVSPELGVGYNVIMLESTGDDLKPQIETVNNEAIEIPRFPEAASDQRLVELAQNLLWSKFGTSTQLFMSDTQVVPRDFDHEKKEAIRGLITTAAMAATMSLTMFAENGKYFTDLNLVTELRQKRGDVGDADLSFVYNFNPQVLMDNLGFPTRASVVIQASTGYRKAKQTASPNSAGGPKVISETCGYVDLMPIAPRAMPFFDGQTMQIPRRLAAVYVLDALRTSFAYTPGAMLLDILVAADMNKENAWVNAFVSKSRARGGSNDLDLTDVGAITIDVPSRENPQVPEARPDTRSQTFTMDALTNFLGTYVKQELNIAMDVPIASSTSWHLSLFAQAALGSPGAIQRANQAMDRLTNGEFLKTLPAGTPIFAGTPMTLERGYWDDGSSRRDLADVDYVAVCNYADATNNPAIVERFTNTFLQTSRSQAYRLKERRDIIQEVTRHTAVFVGRSIRCFFNGAWLANGVKSLATAGITTSSDGRSSFGFGGGRGYAEFLQTSAMPQNVSWNSAYGGGSGTGNTFGGMATSPWGV